MMSSFVYVTMSVSAEEEEEPVVFDTLTVRQTTEEENLERVEPEQWPVVSHHVVTRDDLGQTLIIFD